MTSRRWFVSVLAGGFLAFFRATKAEQPQKLWRIGLLSGGARPSDGAPPIALRKALQELGYVDGKSISFVGRWAEAKGNRLPVLAAELVEIGRAHV